MSINFSNYLVSYVAFVEPTFKNQSKSALSFLRRLTQELEPSMRRMNFSVGFIGGGVISTKISDFSGVKNMKKYIQRVGAAQEEFSSNFVPIAPGVPTELFLQVAQSMYNIADRTIKRFEATGLHKISLQLTSAVHAQQPVFEQHDSGTIDAAYANIIELSTITKPYFVDRRGNIQHRAGALNPYSYKLPTGQDIQTAGYWAFQEFGTSNGVVPRNFFLNISRDLHGVDKEELDKIREWAEDRVKKFQNKIAVK